MRRMCRKTNPFTAPGKGVRLFSTLPQELPAQIGVKENVERDCELGVRKAAIPECGRQFSSTGCSTIAVGYNMNIKQRILLEDQRRCSAGLSARWGVVSCSPCRPAKNRYDPAAALAHERKYAPSFWRANASRNAAYAGKEIRLIDCTQYEQPSQRVPSDTTPPGIAGELYLCRRENRLG